MGPFTIDTAIDQLRKLAFWCIDTKIISEIASITTTAATTDLKHLNNFTSILSQKAYLNSFYSKDYIALYPHNWHYSELLVFRNCVFVCMTCLSILGFHEFEFHCDKTTVDHHLDKLLVYNCHRYAKMKIITRKN